VASQWCAPPFSNNQIATRKGLKMSKGMNHAKVNMKKRIADEYRRLGDPRRKAMFADGTTGWVGENSSKPPVIREAKHKQKR
jgi:hypothetical protein